MSRGGPADYGDIAQASAHMPVPHPDMRCRQRRGVKLGIKAQGLSFHPMVTGEGKVGRVNNREPSMMPR
jgi:hypothetical protein